MKKFAVIGNPINHSLSPLMHESIFKQIGLKASYEKIQIKPFELEKFVRSNKLDGYNVTIPYKNKFVRKNYIPPLNPNLFRCFNNTFRINPVKKNF